jgi:hypothetical protein
VVTIGRQDPAQQTITRPDKGPLVLLRLPEAIATRVAAVSLEHPVTVTLR